MKIKISALLLCLASALVLGLVNYPSISVWTLFGSAVGRALRTPQALRWFNRSDAGPAG